MNQNQDYWKEKVRGVESVTCLLSYSRIYVPTTCDYESYVLTHSDYRNRVPMRPWLWGLWQPAWLWKPCVHCLLTVEAMCPLTPDWGSHVSNLTPDCGSHVSTAPWLWKPCVHLPPDCGSRVSSLTTVFRGDVLTDSHYCHQTFPIMIPYSLNFWAKLIPSLCGIMYFVTAMAKVSNSLRSVTQLAGRRARV